MTLPTAMSIRNRIAYKDEASMIRTVTLDETEAVAFADLIEWSERVVALYGEEHSDCLGRLNPGLCETCALLRERP